MLTLVNYKYSKRYKYNWELTIFITSVEIEFCLILAGFGSKFHWIKERK